MSRQNRKYIFILIASVLVLVLVEMMTPKPIDWRESYSKEHKIPYGNAVLYSMLDNLFPGQPVQNNYQTVYELAVAEGIYATAGDSVMEETLKKNLIFINNTFSPDSTSGQALMQIAWAGAHVFIAAEDFEGWFAREMNIVTKSNYYFKGNPESANWDSVATHFVNPALQSSKPYEFKRGTLRSHFEKAGLGTPLDSGVVILGRNSLGAPNFIRVNHGHGAFFLHSAPLVFTNYNMLAGNNSEYVARALSYLPVQPVVWDEYFKVGRGESSSPMRFVLSSPALRWAWYGLLVTVVLFILFRAKRRQRAIPIVRPPQNTSLEFARTIGSLYFQYKNHKNLAEKKIAYFYEFLRNHYYINTRNIDQEAVEKIASKSGLTTDKVKYLFSTIAQVENSREISEQNLQMLNREIENFYKQS